MWMDEGAGQQVSDGRVFRQASRTYFAPRERYGNGFSWGDKNDNISFLRTNDGLWMPSNFGTSLGNSHREITIGDFGIGSDENVIRLRTYMFGGQLLVEYAMDGKLQYVDVTKEEQEHIALGGYLIEQGREPIEYHGYSFLNRPVDPSKFYEDGDSFVIVSLPVDGLSDVVKLKKQIDPLRTIAALVPPKYWVNPLAPTPEEDRSWRNSDFMSIFGIEYMRDQDKGIAEYPGIYMPKNFDRKHYINIPQE